MANLLIVHPLHMAEILLTVVITIIFEPKKLPIWVKCLIFVGLSFMVAYGALDIYAMSKMELAVTLTIYSLTCYFVALVVGVRYRRRRTDRMWILLSVVIGIAIFALYARFLYRPAASVPDSFKTDNANGPAVEGNQDEDEYLRRIREEFIEVGGARSSAAPAEELPPPAGQQPHKKRRPTSLNRRPFTEGNNDEL